VSVFLPFPLEIELGHQRDRDPRGVTQTIVSGVLQEQHIRRPEAGASRGRMLIGPRPSEYRGVDLARSMFANRISDRDAACGNGSKDAYAYDARGCSIRFDLTAGETQDRKSLTICSIIPVAISSCLPIARRQGGYEMARAGACSAGETPHKRMMQSGLVWPRNV
jgi:hypothetical protein